MSIFHERLRELRKSRNASQAVLAELMGVKPRAYRRYESGEREPKIDALIALSDYFGVSLDYLVGQEKEREK